MEKHFKIALFSNIRNIRNCEKAAEQSNAKISNLYGDLPWHETALINFFLAYFSPNDHLLTCESAKK